MGTDLPLVQPVYLRLLARAAEAEGIALERWLAPLGLCGPQLARSDAPVALAFWRHLILGLQRAEARPGLAIRLGRQVPLLAHGPLAYLMASADSLKQAMEVLARFAPLRLAVLDLRLRERETDFELQLRPRVALGDVERFTLDYLMAMMLSMLEGLTAGGSAAVTLVLPGRQADDAACWVGQGVRLDRGTGWPALRVAAPEALARLPTSCATDFRRAWAACEEAEREHGWADSISARIEQLFRTGQVASYQLAEVSGHLGISRRTVMRRLGVEGARFSELVDASRQQKFLRRLTERRLGLAEIAEELGYADAAVLSRAVQRWFGSSVRALRKQLGADAAPPPRPVAKGKFVGTR